jgi:hypothetical protein
MLDLAAVRENLGDPKECLALVERYAATLGPDARAHAALTPGTRAEPYIHHGDLTVAGHLDVRAPLVVTGSVTVDGVLTDCGPDSLVLVAGDLRAGAVFTDGDMYVGGDLTAAVVYGERNDNTLAARLIRSRLVIEDDHDVQAEVVAEHHFDIDLFEQGYGDGVQERLRGILVDEVFAGDEDDSELRLDRELLADRLRDGTPIFRA